MSRKIKNRRPARPVRRTRRSSRPVEELRLDPPRKVSHEPPRAYARIWP